MADILDGLSALTLNIQEATQDSDLIKVNPYLSPEITKIHGVQTGVIMDKYIPILGQIEDIGHIDPGGCSTNSYITSIPVSQKTWTPKLFSERITICADDIPARLKFWMEQNVASKRWELINKPLEQWVLDLTALALQRAIIRIAEFGDTAADVVGSGGYLTAGSDKTLFNGLSGFWKQIFVDQALGSPLSFRYTIDENTQATKTAQMTLGDNTAYNAFSALTEGIAPEAMTSMLPIQCTKTLWDNWVRFMEKNSGAYKPEILENGTTKEQFRGHPIIVRTDWDRLIKKYHDLGTTFYLPHRAVMFDINNAPIGTSDTQSFSALDSFYDKVSKKLYIDTAWRLDCKILQEENIASAY